MKTSPGRMPASSASTDPGRQGQAGTAGGKANNLAILSERGLDVPRWRCIDAKQYDAFIAPCRPVLQALLDATTDRASSLRETARLIDDVLQTAAMPVNLAAALSGLEVGRPGARFAVRSSCDVEDGGAQSYAGVFDSFLFIPPAGIEEMVRACWCSVFNTSALSYLHKHGRSPLDLHMTVIVQEMVNSQKSGVLFQSNPVGRLQETMIVAGYGLGEGIVSDQVATDTYCYDRSTRTMRSDIRTKTSCLAFDEVAGHGVKEAVVPVALHDKPVLSEAELTSLLALSRALESIYTHPQDVEWAFDQGGRLWVLQSRPITTIPAGELALYDNSNITESYPGISSPLTASLVKKIYARLFHAAFFHAGCSERMLKPYEAAFGSMVESIQGRIYYNLSNWYKLMSLLPFSSRVFVPALEDALGTRRANTEQGPRLMRLYPKVRLLVSAFTRFFSIHRLRRRYERDFTATYTATRRAIDEARSTTELQAVFAGFFDRIFHVVQFGRVSDTYLMLFLQAVRVFFVRLGMTDNAAQQLINDLLVAEDDLASVQPIKSIRHMAEQVRASEPLRELLRGVDSWDDLLLLLEPFASFRHSLLEHIDLYGDRTIAELKFETRTFRQNPLALVRMVLSNAGDKPRADNERLGQEGRLRAQAQDRLDGLLAGHPLRRRVGHFLVDRLRLFIRLREFVRFNRARYYGLIRDIIGRIAVDWHASGLLEHPDDIFLLTDEEVLGGARPADAASMCELVEERRAQWAAYEQHRPEDRLWLRGDVARNVIPQLAPESAADGPCTDLLQGLGCCSGLVEANARVLIHPDEHADVSDKILVANNTDPGWVFLIMRAAGLIVERGSVLSHTAIIGRELGIPTIVGVKHATQLLRDGACIRMDGSAGTVQATAV